MKIFMKISLKSVIFFILTLTIFFSGRVLAYEEQTPFEYLYVEDWSRELDRLDYICLGVSANI